MRRTLTLLALAGLGVTLATLIRRRRQPLSNQEFAELVDLSRSERGGLSRRYRKLMTRWVDEVAAQDVEREVALHPNDPAWFRELNWRTMR